MSPSRSSRWLDHRAASVIALLLLGVTAVASAFGWAAADRVAAGAFLAIAVAVLQAAASAVLAGRRRRTS